MRPLFTIHAGEYLVGAFIEKEFDYCRVWVPSKDTGIDLLVTDSKCSKTISLQVKFSKDFIPTHEEDLYKNVVKVGTWFKFFHKAIRESDANYWILVMQSHAISRPQFLIIKPNTLLERLICYHGEKTKYDLYFWVTTKGRCLEMRGLRKNQKKEIIKNPSTMPHRDFSEFIDDWSALEELR